MATKIFLLQSLLLVGLLAHGQFFQNLDFEEGNGILPDGWEVEGNGTASWLSSDTFQGKVITSGGSKFLKLSLTEDQDYIKLSNRMPFNNLMVSELSYQFLYLGDENARISAMRYIGYNWDSSLMGRRTVFNLVLSVYRTWFGTFKDQPDTFNFGEKGGGIRKITEYSHLKPDSVSLEFTISDFGNKSTHNILYIDDIVMKTYLASTTAVKPQKLAIFPNPVSDILHLSLPAGKYEAAIRNVQGQLVLTKIVEDNLLFFADLPSGLYFLQIFDLQTGKQYFSKVQRE